jgi:hypothetical protein
VPVRNPFDVVIEAAMELVDGLGAAAQERPSERQELLERMNEIRAAVYAIRP